MGSTNNTAGNTKHSSYSFAVYAFARLIKTGRIVAATN
jgi:hypothetical protein